MDGGLVSLCDGGNEYDAFVAQLDRAPGFESGGWKFESFQACEEPITQWLEYTPDKRKVSSSSLLGLNDG